MTAPPRPAGRTVRRALRRHRRGLAALCAATATWCALQALAPAAPATVAVPVAARDLAAGSTLGVDDVVTVRVPTATRPDGVTVPAAGAVLAAAIRRGETFTDVRLVRPDGQRRPAGTVVVTIRTADPAAVLTVRPGDRIDVLAAAAGDGLSTGGAVEGPPPEAPGVEAPTGGETDGDTSDGDTSDGDTSDGDTSDGDTSDGGEAAAGASLGPAVGPGWELRAATLARDLLVLAVPGAAGAGADAPDPADSTGSGAAGPAGGGLLGVDPAAAPVDTSGVLVVAADRAAAGRLAAAVGHSLTVAVVSP